MDRLEEARVMFGTLCRAFDEMDWRYRASEEDGDYVVRTGVVGEDLTMHLFIRIDTDREVMYLNSQMPFTVPEDRRDFMAQALIRANWSILNGSFEMDYSDGMIGFKVVIPYMGSAIDVSVCTYMIQLSCATIDKFNDKFLAMLEGRLTMEGLQAFIDE